jgi:hypothetical protein
MAFKAGAHFGAGAGAGKGTGADAGAGAGAGASFIDVDKRICELEKELKTLRALKKETEETENKDTVKISEKSIDDPVIFLDQLKKNTVKLTRYYSLFLAIRNMFKTQIPYSYPSLYGSLARKMFEVPLAVMTGNLTFGNPTGSDIDIAVFDSETDFNLYRNELANLISKIEKDILIASVNKNELEFADRFILKKIKNLTLSQNDISSVDPIGRRLLAGIPHYVFTFLDKESGTGVEAEIMAHVPESDEWGADMDVNAIRIGNEISSRNKSIAMHDILHSILTRQPRDIIHFENYQIEAFTSGKLHSEKMKQLLAIIFFMNVRYKKFLEAGYTTIYSHEHNRILTIGIEKEERCYITDTETPYIYVVLECGHKLSLCAYVGIVCARNDNSEAIRCPLCRKNLKILFVDNKPSFPLFPSIGTSVPDTDVIQHENKPLNFQLSGCNDIAEIIAGVIVSNGGSQNINHGRRRNDHS